MEQGLLCVECHNYIFKSGLGFPTLIPFTSTYSASIKSHIVAYMYSLCPLFFLFLGVIF